ncbi:MAG: hypothetical protein ACD_28C00299G0002 [uncultured bacterium]|nr:MAG: hypothetical protein ACD_28C00299G0002 [uncultured bacterium]
MKHQKSEIYFLLTILLGVFGITFFVFKPFLYSLILAIIFATVFAPVQYKVLQLTHQKRGLSAFLCTLAVLAVVIVPLSFIAAQIVKEASSLYTFLTSEEGSSILSRGLENAWNSLKTFIPIPSDFTFDINQYAKQGLTWIVGHLGSLASNIASATASLLIFLMALYYAFKDGETFKKSLVSLSPLQDIHDIQIFNKLTLAINAVIKGNLTVALVQGAVTTVGLLIFGVPSAILWGSITAVTALIPGLGTSLVVIPSVLFLFFTGETISAIGLLIWGLTAVGLVDNVLGPKLVEKGMQVHPFLILLSILGGLGLFGALGFILGPILLSLLFALLEIYVTLRKEQKTSS